MIHRIAECGKEHEGQRSKHVTHCVWRKPKPHETAHVRQVNSQEYLDRTNNDTEGEVRFHAGYRREEDEGKTEHRKTKHRRERAEHAKGNFDDDWFHSCLL